MKPLVTIARRKLFSSAHFYHQSSWSDRQNQTEFGPCFSPYGHGHNYVLECFVTGRVSSKTKMVMNVTDLDALMTEAVAPFEHRHINKEIKEFAVPGDSKTDSLIPTTEVLALTLRELVQRRLSRSLKLTRLRLFETDDIFVDLREREYPEAKHKYHFTQQVELRSMHHIYNDQLSVAENRKILGRCMRPHGHHYKIQVVLGTDRLNSLSGQVVDRSRLNEVLRMKLVSPLDGRDLNLIFPNTACEALAYDLFCHLQSMLSAEFPTAELVCIGIQETEKNYFEFFPVG